MIYSQTLLAISACARARRATGRPASSHLETRISNSLMMSISERQTLAAAKALASAPAIPLLLVVAGLRSYSDGPIKITKAGWHGARGIDDHAPFTKALTALDGADLTAELARTLSTTLDLRR